MENKSFLHLTLLTIIFITTSLPPSLSLTISLNSSLSTLTPTKTWTSPNSTFTLQFLPSNTTSYTLSITYATTPVWSAAAGTAVSAGATFILTTSGDLQLVSAAGDQVWHSNTSNLGVTHGSLSDIGNFMLMNGSNHVVWSTFDNPTDTFVQSQNFSVGMKLSSGLYSFSLNSTGNLTLQWNNDIVYYSAGLNSSVNVNSSSGNPILMLSGGILSLYDSNFNLLQKLIYGSDFGGDNAGNILGIMRLDSDGNLRMYNVDSGSASASVTWTAISDQCLVFGYCGNMGICSYNETSPFCGCPSQNFEPVDEKDSRKGCKLKEQIKDCPGNSVTTLQLDNTKFLNYPPETNDAYFINSVACRGNCLSGGSCVGSTSLGDGSGQCYIKSSSFVSGYQSGALPSTSYVKVCGPVLPNSPPHAEDTRRRARLKGWIIAVVIILTVVVLVIIEGSVWWWCCRKSSKFASLSAQYALLEYASGAPVQFSYRELQQATNGFKEKLGEGGFGTVYKGVLANKTLSAVKQLEGIEQGEKQFRMEVATISSTHHLNLVRLIGFCSEGRHRLLVYEFMKNGSLDTYLFGTHEKSLLSWENRFSIAVGMAKGITYLHEECRDCIVHCDIKPENILLDDNYNAKVSDFGLAKLINPKDHRYRTLTSVRGTRGYLAPEWIANLPITSKSDVYSFGMVLLEIVSGRRNFEVSDLTNRTKFSIWAYNEFDKGNISTIVDQRLDLDPGEVMDMGQVSRAIQVGFWCIQEQPGQRPMMGKVVQMLEGIMEIPRPPTPKAPKDGSSISGASMNSFTGRSISTVSAPAGPSTSLSLHAQRGTPYYSSVDLERPVSVSFPGLRET